MRSGVLDATGIHVDKWTTGSSTSGAIPRFRWPCRLVRRVGRCLAVPV